MQRLTKSLSEKIYLLSANQVNDNQWDFRVKGQSKNIYEQILKPDSFYCSCPDHRTKHSFCKHLLFLISRVAVQINIACDVCTNKSNWKDTVYNLCSTSWIERLKERLNKVNNSTKSKAIGNDCSICFEEMVEGESFSQCVTTCKNYFHEGCINLWLQSYHSTCPLCRGNWDNTQYNEEDEIQLEVNLYNNAIQPDNHVDVVEENNNNNNIPTNIKLFTAMNNETIKDFCAQNNLVYYPGSCYYQFIKTELIQSHKRIILMDKNTNEFFEGCDARGILGLPSDASMKIKPKTFNNYNIFIQSTTSTRKLVSDQMLIYKSCM